MCFISLFPIPHSIHKFNILILSSFFAILDIFKPFIFGGFSHFFLPSCQFPCFGKKKNLALFPQSTIFRFTCVSVILAPCFRICLPLFYCHFFFFFNAFVAWIISLVSLSYGIYTFSVALGYRMCVHSLLSFKNTFHCLIEFTCLSPKNIWDIFFGCCCCSYSWLRKVNG